MNLLSIFFAPNYLDLLPIFIQQYKALRFKSDVDEFTLVSRIIAKYHAEYNNEELAKPDTFRRLQGDFNLKSMLENAVIFCKNVRLANMFDSPNCFLSPSNQRQFINSNIFEEDDNNIFAVCYSKDVLKVHNPDAFQTAGGCQTFESKEGAEVYLCLNPYHGILIKVPMWLTYENYNNNFAGVRLSGGESFLEKKGEPIFKYIQTKSHDFLEVIEKYNLTIDKINLSKGRSILNDYL